MKLSKRLRKWKANITTQTPIDYVVTLWEDVNGFADEAKALERENANLRGMVAVLWKCCASNADPFWCGGCDYHDVDGCKVKGQIDRLGIEVDK